jgi:diguanylate cyclase
LPSLWSAESVRVQARFLPTLLMGFIVLVVLVNIYFLEQRRQIKRSRIQVFQQLLRAEVAERDARMDPLTDCFNRRCLEPLLQKEIKRAKRMSTPISVVVIDLDNFRSVNSKFGHLQGDGILKTMVGLIRNTLRASDTIVRYGGDEFVCILPEATDHQAHCAMGRVMNAVGKWNAKKEVPGYEMSLSWGVAEYEEGVSSPDLVDRADRKMYEAKHRGRVPVS